MPVVSGVGGGETGALPGWPAWAELKHAETVTLQSGDTRVFERCAPKERLIVVRGECAVSTAPGGPAEAVSAKAKFALEDANGRFSIESVTAPTTVVRLGGTWGDATGGYGVFGAAPVADAVERGDPTPYVKRTGVDNHYHDCDEYWLILEGRGRVATEGVLFDVGPGDCVLTAAGDHHDFPEAYEPVTAVYFETTLVGQGRRGHLWEHTHGPARSNDTRG